MLDNVNIRQSDMFVLKVSCTRTYTINLHQSLMQEICASFSYQKLSNTADQLKLTIVFTFIHKSFWHKFLERVSWAL